jgi:hypothetical protein
MFNKKKKIPDGFTGICHLYYFSGCAMALVLTQPLTEMSIRNIFWGRSGRWLWLATLPPSCADCLSIWEPQPTGTPWASPGL